MIFAELPGKVLNSPQVDRRIVSLFPVLRRSDLRGFFPVATYRHGDSSITFPTDEYCTFYLSFQTRNIRVSHLIAAVVGGLPSVSLTHDIPAIHPHFRPDACSGELLHFHCPRQGRLNMTVASTLLAGVPRYTLGPEWRKCDSQMLVVKGLTYFNLHVQKAVSARPNETGSVYITFA